MQSVLLFSILGVIQIEDKIKNHVQGEKFLNYLFLLSMLCQKDRWYRKHTQGQASLEIYSQYLSPIMKILFLSPCNSIEEERRSCINLF